MSEPSVIRIKPFHYIHVLDNNSNVTRVVEGPCTFTKQDHERVVLNPEPMILIPPRHYCTISNPVIRDEKGQAVKDANGQVKLRHGDDEMRFESPDPFSLFPGEKVSGKVTPLQVVAPGTALRLKCTRDFTDETTKKNYIAGDEWLFQGPGTYRPRVEVQVIELVKGLVILPNQALKIRARKQTTDKKGGKREAGEEWLVRDTGAYLPGVDEEVIQTLEATILNDKKALHLKAERAFKDIFGHNRKAGEEWLVTVKETDIYIPDVYEKLVGEVRITSLSNRQYCVVLDPWKDGVQRLGQRELRKGEASFFLQPGERLEKGIQDILVLGEEEALLLRAREAYTDTKTKKTYSPGERWMIYGPTDFVPPTEVEVIETRKSIPLDENEGIYIRDIKTGKVSTIVGQSYMLKPNEELWEKNLPKQVEELLYKDREDRHGERNKTRVVAFRAPHNSAVQIYDLKEKVSRVVFGPELVMLGPDEDFSIVTLSGGQPKQPGIIKTLAVMLGPDFMTDIVVVETADHARLSLKLSYNWQFEIDKSNKQQAAKIFQVPDFVGDACKAMASRVRGAVAGVNFDQFHKKSADIIRSAIFSGEKTKFVFNANNLVVTNVDIQSVEPVDQKTRDSLQKSVQLAIEITTKSQEATARHESTRLEQEAMGKLERQKITDQAEAEKTRKNLIQLQAESAAIESTGQATAEARARAEAATIEGEANVKQAQLLAQATKIKAESELIQSNKRQDAEIEHKRALNKLEIEKAQKLGEIESLKFKQMVGAIGKNTIKAMAEAGPQTQLKLLQGLGLKSFLITDGNSPINLFNTAQGLIGGPNGQQ